MLKNDKEKLEEISKYVNDKLFTLRTFEDEWTIDGKVVLKEIKDLMK